MSNTDTDEERKPRTPEEGEEPKEQEPEPAAALPSWLGLGFLDGLFLDR
jgi:hypothetical protein